MTKSDAIRKVLSTAGRPLSIDELQPRVERKVKVIVHRYRLYNLLSVMQTAGEIESTGCGDERRYALKQRKAAA